MDEIYNDCTKCYKLCNAIYFQHKFIDWTSGNNDIDKLIQATQLLSHKNVKVALELIPYHRLDDIKYIDENKFGKVYKANWIDGCIFRWSIYKRDWIRHQNMVVKLESLNNLKNVKFGFINKIRKDHEFYGITQDPETGNYLIVLKDICEKCNNVCNVIHFQNNFENWTSGNNDIDKLIQDTQLSSHNETTHVLEWIPYDRFYSIEYIKENKLGKVYRANWIDGCIWYWEEITQNWKRNDHMFVILESLNTPKIFTLELINKV
ncbi:hypothetical protein RhiirA1_457764 [Rhizophagus irregularis]|uniref:Uncharacterized protein n=1 Tax=Rhizophagus irregularis TaxID=588596 RepID=A0A2N0RXH0_9GLOM|nr:hypothetical protein RhiirA1_457764 [Rhizophagus irregularis]